MTMLRRYEIYQVDPNASKETVAVMDKSMRHAQRLIPEVLHSAVGYNKSPVGLSFVWEHGYEDSAAYNCEISPRTAYPTCQPSQATL